MKKFKIVYSIAADGSALLWNIDHDAATIEANNPTEAAQILRYYCRAWNYNRPNIHSITQQ